MYPTWERRCYGVYCTPDPVVSYMVRNGTNLRAESGSIAHRTSKESQKKSGTFPSEAIGYVRSGFCTEKKERELFCEEPNAYIATVVALDETARRMRTIDETGVLEREKTHGARSREIESASVDRCFRGALDAPSVQE